MGNSMYLLESDEEKIENSQLEWITRNSEKFGFEYVLQESEERVITLKVKKNSQKRKSN